MTEVAVSSFSRTICFAAAGLGAACFFILLGFLAVVMRRAAAARARAAASAAIRPDLRVALVEYVAGANDDSRLRSAMAEHADDVADCILGFQGAVGGSARDRLCRLALDLGLVHTWCEQSRSRDVLKRRAAVSHLGFACIYEPCRRVAGDVLPDALEDPDEEVRLLACRGLAVFGGNTELKRLFTLAQGPNRLMRTVLTEDLRRNATALAGETLREALRSGDTVRTAATLEILAAWERAIPIENLSEFMEHNDRNVRLPAFRLAAFIPADPEVRQTLGRALQNSDKEIRALAIVAMGRQNMREWLPELAACLSREDLELARDAATALAAMPPEGWQRLEELSKSPSQATARAAGDALARVRTGA